MAAGADRLWQNITSVAGPHVDATPVGRKSVLPVVFTLIQQWEIHSRGTVKGILSSHAFLAKNQRWDREGDCLKGVTIEGSGKQKPGSLEDFSPHTS